MAAAVRFPRWPVPLCLITIRHGIFEDEFHRKWIVAKVQTCSYSPYFCGVSFRTRRCITVHLWHLTRFPQEFTPYNPMNYHSLPWMWTLQSMNIYRGTDSKQWRLLTHVQVGDILQLILMLVCD
uniref:Uncharacterized protein n=1 Tax=Mus spicilegus TaxID=10103 RepID=A0A8C6MV57_MUSSI